MMTPTPQTEAVATVLDRELKPVIERWLKRVEDIPSLMAIPLNHSERTGHLPQLIKDLVERLRLDVGAERPETKSAHDHGETRYGQGYSVPMLVEESRLLQVTIFDALRHNQSALEPGTMMEAVVIIADECDSQLKHTVESFIELERNKGLKVA